MARHAFALCTPETASFYHFRLGSHKHRRSVSEAMARGRSNTPKTFRGVPRLESSTLPVREMLYHEPIEWNGVQLTVYPAGHCLGSAMLLAEDGGQSLLYTGDYKLGESATAQAAELPKADILVMESTFGEPRYVFPPRDTVIEQLCETVQAALEVGRTPVILAYLLGKSQEVTRILTDNGFRVVQHPAIAAISRIYESHGMPLGDYGDLSRKKPVPGRDVVIMPPRSRHPVAIGISEKDITRIAVTGWALAPGAIYRYQADHAIPLSDHAGYDELLETIERVEPKKIYCTHGSPDFVDRLQELGFNAYHLGRATQKRLF